MKNTSDSFFTPKRMVFMAPATRENPTPAPEPKNPKDIIGESMPQQPQPLADKKGDVVVGDVETKSQDVIGNARGVDVAFNSKVDQQLVHPNVKKVAATSIVNHLNTEKGKEHFDAIMAGETLPINVPGRYGVRGRRNHNFDVSYNTGTKQIDVTLKSIS